MFLELPHPGTDFSCFVDSRKTAHDMAIHGDKIESASKRTQQMHPNGGTKICSCRIFGQASRSGGVTVHKSVLSSRNLVEDPPGERIRDHVERCSPQNRYAEVKLRVDYGVNSIEKVHTKCSKKGLSYGGCIPTILQAIETVPNLDEALRPWEGTLSSKERSIILKEQASWERAWEVFEWFKGKACYEVNVIHYNIILRILGKAQKWSQVEGLWAEMMKKGIAPINSTYGTLIDVYTKGGRTIEALQWLVQMNEQGMEADEVTMATVIQTYKKSGKFGKAKEFFRKWDETTNKLAPEGPYQDAVRLSPYTYNTLIDTLGKAGQLKEASEIFAQMLREGISPNTVTFNTMIHICGSHGHLKEVASLMQRMEELQCPPDTRTYNILISLYAKHDNIGMAASYFEKMKEASLEPDLVCYRALLCTFSKCQMVAEAEALVSLMDDGKLEIDEFSQSALTRMYIEAGMLQKSWMWFVRFHKEGNMTSECYAANIDAYGERGHVLEAEKAFACCQEAYNLTVLHFNVLIKAYGIVQKHDAACQLFNTMESHGITPDKCSYNTLIQILVSGELPHRARPYITKMLETGSVRDCVACCAVISSFVKMSQLEMAEEVYEEMLRFGVQPDVVVFGVLINAWADAGSVQKALRYVEAMRNTSLPLNLIICNSLIKLYTKAGYLKEAQVVYRDLESSEKGPDVFCSNCMIDLCGKRGLVKEAERIFESLVKKGQANEFSFAMMLCMYRRLGWFKEAYQIAQRMSELKLMTDLLTFNNVLALYASDGRFGEAIQTFMEMLAASVQPDDCTFKSLRLVLVKCGVSKGVVRKMEALRKKDAPSGLQAWSSILSSVVGGGGGGGSGDVKLH